MDRPLCLIIGAGEGLGCSLAKKFSLMGFALGLVSRSESGSRAALKVSRDVAGEKNAEYFKADASDPPSIESACLEAEERFGNPGVLLYNVSGYYARKSPLELDYSELELNYREEVLGALAAAKAIIPGMILRQAGTVIYSSATAAFRGSSTNPLYSLGKFGLRSLSQSLAKAYSKKGVHVAHVRLDCVLDTPSIKKSYPDFDREKMSSTDDVAETYWWIHQQPRTAWSNEVELRPFTEEWTF
ncbi:SDR family NAD(P)-dependent oxidoreductase [Myxococcota bacterium]|nr:SDR family NAD(P)-dependent oxidoreductase [Myxococcota bacterium]|tara:strand:+ start:4883 stop:5611 length:729 start_codon:yes stop_codon:yes gene_type:complete